MTIQQQIASAAEALAVEAKKINDRVDEVDDFLSGQAVKVEAWFNIYTTYTVGTYQISSVTHLLGFRRFGDSWQMALAPAVGTAEDTQYAKPLGQCKLPDRILACQHLDAFLVVYYEALMAQQTRCTEVLGEK